MDNIKVVSIEEGGYYSDKYFSGSLVNVILERDGLKIKCSGISLWDEDLVSNDLLI